MNRFLKTKIARQLRRESTMPERVLWNKIRNRTLGGHKFRRQQPIGPFVADFYCAEAKLVVEVDGKMHNYSLDRDAKRDEWMQHEGIAVFRVQVSEMTMNLDGVLSTIERLLDERVPSE